MDFNITEINGMRTVVVKRNNSWILRIMCISERSIKR